MRKLKSTIAILLTVIMIISVFPVVSFADILQTGITSIQNDFIKVCVDNATGRFSVRTVDGQPVRKKDQNVDMMFRGDDPETSFTTFRINGTDYIFGNPYKFSPTLFSEITAPQVITNTDGSQQLETVWGIEGVSIKQILKLYSDDTDLKNAGNVSIKYEVTNNSAAEVKVGSRILLDTMLGSNDGAAFQIGSISENPLTVERKLTHDPVNDQNIPEEDKNYYKLPSYWVMKDNLDPTNPLATNIYAYGFNNFSEGGINIVDEMIVGHWNSMANTKWDYEVNPNLDFTVDTNDYGSADSAVAFYWQPDRIRTGDLKSYETVYGLGEIIQPESVFDIRYLDEVNQLETNDAQTEYLNNGIFDINLEVENLAMYDMTHTMMTGELTLQSGLSFVQTSNGNVVYDENGNPKTTNERSRKVTYQKTLTVDQIDRGESADIVQGEIVPFTFKVMATGRSWPTTREYMFNVTSPQLEMKLEDTDEELKALYRCNKANFIFLPPVGVAEQTYAYALSPDECFYQDEKYITVNLSNIEAYNLGTKDRDGNYIENTNNFNVYLKEKVTGERYSMDVQKSAMMQISGDGKIGDMRISYRNGNRVDNDNNVIEADLGPTLPIGEYQVQIDFLEGRVEGMDKEQADLYDITTEQTFIVSENEETRIRMANILAIGKSERELTNSEFLEYKATKEAMSYAALAVDPEYEVENVVDNTIPVYDFYTFESEEELDEFNESEEAELLVVIRGMVKQVGEDGNAEDYIVDTTTEPAIINNCVAYSGKDLTFERGKLDVFGLDSLFQKSDIFNHLAVNGEGTLSVASSGFVFHKGQWSLDFYDGFDKVGEEEEEEDEDDDDGDEDDGDEDDGDEGDDKENDEIEWAVGGIGDALNPLRVMTISDVYFNRKSMFSAPSFSVAGFGLKFKEFILRPDEISFGGEINMKIVNADVKNVYFDQEGFKGIESELGFDLGAAIGLLSSSKDGKEDETKASGTITINHYRPGVEGKNNEYGINFEAELAKVGVKCELSFKQVDDGRILPDTIGFGAKIPDPGFPIAGAVQLTAIRGALKELADTIAGGDGEVPLTIEAGVDIEFGVKPANFEGAIDLTLKSTGIKLEGKLDYAGQDMLTHALIEARWVTPWFVKAEAEVDVLGWGVIIGNARMFIGENLELNRTDFEGFVSAALQIPSDIPVVGGLQLGRISMGLNNDKMWGSAGVGVGPIMVSVGVTYYWSGEIEIGSSGEGLPEGYTYLLVQDPEKSRQRLIAIGEGIKTVASSFVTDENTVQKVTYHSIGDGMQIIDNGKSSVGVGGVEVTDGGKTHSVPMGIILNEAMPSDAMLEVEYFGDELPVLQLNNGINTVPVVVGDINNPKKVANANSFVQESEIDGVMQKKLYVLVPHNDIKANSVWTLKSNEKIETKLLSIPQAPALTNASMQVDGNRITANVDASNVKSGDIVNLYLTKEKLGTKTEVKDGLEIVEANDPGILIAKDLDISSGSIEKEIDLKAAELLGKTEDITSLMEQGEYYLRAELKTSNGYDAKVTDNTVKIIDEKAPNAVKDVTVKAVGNGYFEIGFAPADKKPAQSDYEHGYCIDVFKETDGELSTYPNLGGIILMENDLKNNYNEETGRYEKIRVGGWKASSKVYDIYNEDGTPAMEEDGVTQKTGEKTSYIGLETGNEYIIGVSAMTIPDDVTEPEQNNHFAEKTLGAKTLLPVPKKPVLNATVVKLFSIEEPDKYITLVTNEPSPVLDIDVDQNNIEVEVECGGESYGTYKLSDNGNGSVGQIPFESFVSDGKYCVELKAKNTVTGDYSITIVYLSVDTIAPFIYLDSPVTGERTENGKIRVKGTTAADAVALTVNDSAVAIDANGKFDSYVHVESTEPTVPLQITSTDAAGNTNSATVVITNSDFKVPTALVIRKVPTITIGNKTKLEAFLRIPDGTENFTEIPVADENLEKLSFSSYLGSAASVSDTGEITALQEGASIFNAKYNLTDDVCLETIAVVRVNDGSTAPEDDFDIISLSTKAVEGSHDKTMLEISGVAQASDYELVYKVYPKGSEVKLPVLSENLSAWTVVPEDKIISAEDEQLVVVAKRKSGLAIGSSNKATVVTEVYGRLTATPKKIDNVFNKTKIIVKNQDLTNAKLVYKKTTEAPEFDDVLDGTWLDLPENGEIEARSEESIVVAKKDIATNKVILVSRVLSAVCESFISIDAKSEAISGDYTSTKITAPISDAYEYAYMLVPTNTSISLYDDIADYTLLPDNGIISVSGKQKILLALRDKTQKYAVGAKLLTAVVASSHSGGSGGGGGGSFAVAPKIEGTTVINNVTATENVSGSNLVVVLDQQKLTGEQDINVTTTNNKFDSYTYNIGKDLSDGLSSNKKLLTVTTPKGVLKLKESNFGGKDASVSISSADSTNLPALPGTILGTNAVTQISATGINVDENNRLSASIKIPDDIKVSDVMSVVLVNNNKYTPIPWKLNMIGNSAYANINIPNCGKIVFVKNNATFSDVPENHWGLQDINNAASKLLILGNGENTFNPNGDVTRAEYAAILLRTGGFMALDAENIDIKDVSKSDWFYNTMCVSKKIGILKGVGDNVMNPNNSLSRVEAMAMVGRIIRIYGLGKEISYDEAEKIIKNYTDYSELPSWSIEDVALCIDCGIIKGSENKLEPNKNITRVECSAISNRLENIISAN